LCLIIWVKISKKLIKMIIRKIKQENKDKKKLCEKCMKARIRLVTIWLRQRKRTKLGRVSNMEIGNQVHSISEFNSKKLLRFVLDVFILQPNNLVEKLVSLFLVNFWVYNSCDFILRFTINDDQYWNKLIYLRKSVGSD